MKTLLKIKLISVIIFVLFSFNTFGQNSYTGKLFAIKDLSMPIPISGTAPYYYNLITDSGIYLLTLNSIPIKISDGLIIGNNQYYPSDIVTITGTIILKQVSYMEEYYELEIETIETFFLDQDIYSFFGHYAMVGDCVREGGGVEDNYSILSEFTLYEGKQQDLLFSYKSLPNLEIYGVKHYLFLSKDSLFFPTHLFVLDGLGWIYSFAGQGKRDSDSLFINTVNNVYGDNSVVMSSCTCNWKGKKIGVVDTTLIGVIDEAFLEVDFYGLRTTNYMYFLTLNNQVILSNELLIIDDIEYFIGDEVEITGQIVPNPPHKSIEIKTIKKLTSNVESTYSGKIIFLPNPCETVPCLPGAILGLETDTINYVLTENSNWIWNNSLIFADIEYFIDDEVEITGITTTKQDVNSNKYIELEIKSIKKLTSNINIETLPFNNKIYYDAVNQVIILNKTLQNQSLELELYNTQGQIMLKTNNNSISISNLPNGLYLYRLFLNNGELYSGKILK